MINPEEFYQDETNIDKFSKAEIWRRISKEMKAKRRFSIPELDLRSFAYGVAFSVIAFFAVIGAVSMINNLTEHKLPEQIKINNAYKKAVNSFENTLPLFLNTANRSVKIDDRINSRKDELRNLNAAIEELNSDIPRRDYSKMKQIRLRELYRLKLKVLDEIIEMEENQK